MVNDGVEWFGAVCSQAVTISWTPGQVSGAGSENVISTQPSAAPCADANLWGRSYPVIRLDGNAVRGYAETKILGANKQNYVPSIRSWFYRNGVVISAPIPSPTNGPAGGLADITHTATLEFFGPGTYQTQTLHEAIPLYPASCPFVGSNSATTVSPSLEVQRPRISMGVIPYFLGADVLNSNAYSSQTTLTVDNKGASEVPVWTLIGSSSAQHGTLGCANCNTSSFRATRAPQGNACGTFPVQVKASLNGFASEPFWIDIRTPVGLEYLKTEVVYPVGGWENWIWYKVIGNCPGDEMTNVQMNEVFVNAQQHNGSNWDAPLLATAFPQMRVDEDDGKFRLRDTLYEVATPVKFPQPLSPGANFNDESSASLMTSALQYWRVGSTYNGGPGGDPAVGNPTDPNRGGNNATAKGVLVRSNSHYHFLDHGRH